MSEEEQGSIQAVRLFVALPVPAAVTEELSRAQAEFRRRLPGDSVRWARPEQFHLTLVFLGNVAVDRIEDLSRAAHGACQSFAPLRLRAEQIGFFPRARSPRVIWASVHDEREQLSLLQKAVNAATRDFSTQEAEKEFSGHLTLGRVRNMRTHDAGVLEEVAASMADRIFGEWTADAVDLMRSELSASGSRHYRLASFPLSG